MAFLLSCIVIGVNGMAINEPFSPRWLSYLPSEITPVYRCFAGTDTGKGLQCLADALGRMLPPQELDQDSEDLQRQRHLNAAETDEYDNDAETKEVSTYKEGRRRKRKRNLAIPAVIGLGIIIVTMIVGVTGLVAGKALALSFLALVMTLGLSTKAASSNQRSKVIKDEIPDALSEIGHQLFAEGAHPEEALAYSSYFKRDG